MEENIYFFAVFRIIHRFICESMKKFQIVEGCVAYNCNTGCDSCSGQTGSE